MGTYTLESKPFAALPSVHLGTGTFSGNAWVVDPLSVNLDVNSPLKFKNVQYKITVMSVEIATNAAPNWFGVSFRQDINSFDTVNIFCHPFPTKGMRDEYYAARTGEWPRLFRYAQYFAWQMDIARTNHITIIPFFTAGSYANTGIFGPNWKDIVEQILALARAEASASQAPAGRAHVANTPIESVKYSSGTSKKGAPAPAADMSGRLKHVVLSDFSHGRQLMGTVRSQSPGLERFLREVWDFDGVHAHAPISPRAILYYDLGGGGASSPTNFPVPPERWQEYHHAILKKEQLHGDIPAMLACHAATISRVG